jgi:hypothetical protein
MSIHLALNVKYSKPCNFRPKMLQDLSSKQVSGLVEGEILIRILRPRIAHSATFQSDVVNSYLFLGHMDVNFGSANGIVQHGQGCTFV